MYKNVCKQYIVAFGGACLCFTTLNSYRQLAIGSRLRHQICNNRILELISGKYTAFISQPPPLILTASKPTHLVAYYRTMFLLGRSQAGFTKCKLISANNYA